MNLQEIKAQYEAGVSLRKLSIEHSINRKRLSNLLKAIDVQVKPAVTYTSKPSKHVYNTGVFRDLKTEEQAYWYGFLSADGFLDVDRWSIEVCLGEKDQSHVCKLADFISPSIVPKERVIRLGDKSYTAYRLIISSKDICQNMLNHGFRYRKASGISIPSEILSNGMLNHFLRGYFDGDGSIASRGGNWRERYAYIEFFGYEDFMVNIQNTLAEKIQTPSNKLTTHGKAKGLRFGGINNVIKVCNFLYDNATIYLPRKYEEYQKVVNIAHLLSNKQENSG